MSTPVNYYLGLKRGAPHNTNLVVAGTTTAGSAVDVEVRLQINNGTNATGLSKKDALLLMETIEHFIENNGINRAGANLPAS